MLRLFRFQVVLLFIVVVFCAVYAFASSDTGIPSGGEGVSIISGWTISNVQYRLTDETAKVSAVEFDLDGPAGMVRVGFGSFNNVYFNCANSNDTHWVCDVHPQMKVAEINELQVVALGN